MDDDIRFCVLIELANGFVLHQVVLLLPRHKNLRRRFEFELFHQARPEETGTAGDDDALTIPDVHAFLELEIPLILTDSASRSASTIMRTSSRKLTLGRQPSSWRALEALPRRRSTSVV